MKNKLLRIGALVAGLLISVATVSTVAHAEETSYSYIYDYWGDVQEAPDSYAVCKVFTSADLGLELGLKNPSGIFVIDDLVYVVDTGNNRIVVLQRIGLDDMEVVRIIDKIKGSDIKTLNAPSDVAVDDEGNIFIADRNNYRIIKVDKNLNLLTTFVIPKDPSIQEGTEFLPNKIVIDTAGRVYCIASGINKGLIKYEADGSFSGFIGATKVSYDFSDYLYKKFASQEQLNQLAAFVPTEYSNIYMDHEGFIYASANSFEEEELKAEKVDAVRKLNLLGNDILVRNGEWPVYGDLYWGTGGGHTGPSAFTDVTVLDNDIYILLDKNRGRVFAYDDQGNMVFIFGGNGNMDGYFRQPAAIEHMDRDLLVLDSLDCSITLFTPTEFGSMVYDAFDLFDDGKYDESGDAWREVMKLDGNYTLAYIGIGRAYMRQENYKDSLDYFELKYDADNYSKAFQQYRKEWVEDHIAIIVVILILLFVIPLGIGRYRAIQHEIYTADIFKKFD